MNSLSLHRGVKVFLSILALSVLMASAPLRAENDKRSSGSSKGSNGREPVSSLSPLNRAVTSGIKALTVRKATSLEKVQVKASTGKDSAGSAPRIVSTRVSADVFTTRVELASDEPLVDISIYNMLGKRVMDVFKGPSSRGLHEHTQSISDLPEGVYMCVMQGGSFRKAEKFFFSR